jgi:2'-5' RNA ligase
MESKNPLILTVRLDENSQQFFDTMRKKYFPPERNVLDAHLTLFHQLPNTAETLRLVKEVSKNPFQIQVNRLINLGAGVAYKIESAELESLRKDLKNDFNDNLIPQDKQGFRGHITIQNKTTPEQAKSLIAELLKDFKAFHITAKGLDLWEYLGGPWKHRTYHEFIDPK